MSGGRVNYSEDRPALHTALRAPLDVVIQVEERNVMEEIGRAKQKMYALCAQIRDQQWCGYSDKLITDIVNIGVGGSDLGPRFCLQALLDCATPNLNYHFISDADPNAFNRVTAKLNPETTLFIISSKSFTRKRSTKAVHEQHQDILTSRTQTKYCRHDIAIMEEEWSQY